MTPENRSTIILVILLTLLTAISGIVTNMASETIPDNLKPYTWPLWILIVLAIVFITVKQLRPGDSDASKTNPQSDRDQPFIFPNDHPLTGTIRQLESQTRSLAAALQVDYKVLEQPLDWAGLKRVAHQVSGRKMSRVAGRYDRSLYLPRKEMDAEIQAFLDSDRAGYVMVGKSGAGKSNYLLAFEESCQGDDSDICPVLYDGAILDPGLSLIQGLSDDFRKEIGGSLRFNIFEEIQRIEGIDRCKVVICIDAVNENSAAPALLTRIDELVRDAPWPWLKVILTTRPEAWQLIKSNVFLGEARYYQGEAEAAPTEIAAFNYSGEMDVFSQAELESAYENYRKVYDLQTAYEDLPPEVRTALQDPLILQLVGRIHRGGKIPRTIKVHEVVRDYIHFLTSGKPSERRLWDEDIQFLQERLMPLMIREDRPDNKITGKMILEADQTLQKGGRRLKDLIFGTAFTGSEPANRSFRNLVDAQILSYSGRNEDYRIYFEYDRYWDYFGGARLFELLQKDANPVRLLEKMIYTIRAKPFMWGVLSDALFRVLAQGDLDTLVSLAGSENQDCRDLATTSLVDYASEDRSLVLRSLKILVPNWARRKLLRAAENRALVAIEVTWHLRRYQDLVKALQAGSPKVRDRAVVAAYRLWRDDHEVGFQILERIAGQAGLRALLFNRGGLLSGINLSLLIFFLHYREPDKPGSKVLEVWQPGIRRLLLFNRDRRRGERIKSIVRTRLLALVAFTIDLLLRGIPRRYLVISLPELRQYYKLPPEVKEIAISLADYLDGTKDDLASLESTLEELFSMKVDGVLVNNMLLKLLVDYALVAQGLVRPEQTLKLVKTLAERELDSAEISKRIQWDKCWVYAALALLQEPQIDDVLFEQYSNYVRRCFIEVKQWHGALREYAYLGYSDYAQIHLKKYQNSEVSLLKEMLGWSCLRKEHQKTRDILEELGYLAGSPAWPVVLFVIEPALVYTEEEDPSKPFPDQQVAVRDKLIDVLATARARHPFEVEGFLQKNSVPRAFCEQVRVRKTDERITGDLLKGGLGAWGKFQIREGFSKRGRPVMVQIYRSALKAGGFAGFILEVSKMALNFLTNEEIFQDSQLNFGDLDSEPETTLFNPITESDEIRDF